ncbi:MAG: outer membrane lipoprotein-sorting protein [Saprospiraceae bacterium]|nr:outer membrane lipoprotein-sorting protein [Saprospiraceae bacterium]
MKETTKKRQAKDQQQTTERIPWKFGLEVKDLTNPITIRRVRLLQAGLLTILLSYGGYYLWENFLRAPTGVELVNEMVEAAGSMEAWNAIKSGQFTRTQNVYGEDGSNLSHQVETFYFQKTDEGLKLMVKAIDKNGEEIIIAEDKDGFWATSKSTPADPKKTSRDLGMMCDSKFCQPNCAAQMAFYRFSMPFKLGDSGVRPDVNNMSALNLLDWNPLENIDMERDPLVLDVSYKPTVGKDKWRFLVDPETKLIHKMEYYNKSDFGTYRPEEIYWSDHKTVDGITFSHRWTRYWGNGKVMDEYVYSDVSFNNEIDDSFFNRPAGLDWAAVNN